MQCSDARLQASYETYLETRRALGRTKPICLMDLATLAAKLFSNKAKGGKA